MIKLPKQYSTEKEKYKHHNGKEKISYSQFTSYSDEQYRNDYYVQYFSGIDLPSGEFALYGNYCGTTIEAIATNQDITAPLSVADIEILKTKIEYPENCLYEDEIVIELGDNLVCQGFTDRTWEKEPGKVEILDFKTGNAAKKKEFYESDQYGQTSIYSWQKEIEGYEILDSSVILIGRKGNSFTGKYPFYLSGEIIPIPTPYSKERAEKFLADIKKTVEEISYDYGIFLKYFK